MNLKKLSTYFFIFRRWTHKSQQFKITKLGALTICDYIHDEKYTLLVQVKLYLGFFLLFYELFLSLLKNIPT